MSRNEAEATAKIRNYQFNIANLKKDLEEMFSKNKILTET